MVCVLPFRWDDDRLTLPDLLAVECGDDVARFQTGHGGGFSCLHAGDAHSRTAALVVGVGRYGLGFGVNIATTAPGYESTTGPAQSR